MKAIIIVIGRSVNGKALDPSRWGGFQFEVLSALAHLGDYFRSMSGVGQMEGIVEENLTVHGQIHEGNVNRLRSYLKGIGRTYDQDGILFIVGDAEYVKAGE